MLNAERKKNGDMKIGKKVLLVLLAVGMLLLCGCNQEKKADEEQEVIIETQEEEIEEFEKPEEPEEPEEPEGPEEPEEPEESEEDVNYYGIYWSDRSKDEVETFAKRVRQEILDRDWEALSADCLYPVRVAGEWVNSPEELIAILSQADISEAFMQDVENETCEDMFANSHGSMFGYGSVWISCRVGEDPMGPYDMGVITLNF